LSKELMQKEDQLRIRELELQKKNEQLEINEKEFQTRLGELQTRQDKILGCIDDHNEQENQRIIHMVKVIEGMKAKNAAEVLSVQDIGISVKILGMLKAEKVSKIFNLMDKEISARLQKHYLTM